MQNNRREGEGVGSSIELKKGKREETDGRKEKRESLQRWRRDRRVLSDCVRASEKKCQVPCIRTRPLPQHTGHQPKTPVFLGHAVLVSGGIMRCILKGAGINCKSLLYQLILLLWDVYFLTLIIHTLNKFPDIYSTAIDYLMIMYYIIEKGKGVNIWCSQQHHQQHYNDVRDAFVPQWDATLSQGAWTSKHHAADDEYVQGHLPIKNKHI